MMRRLWSRLSEWEYSWLCLLVIVTLALHFAVIARPAEPMFDEQHYVPDARSILQGDGTQRPEHPPLGKLFIVSGMFLFGDNPIGWRFFSVVFGTLIVILFYLVCRRLDMSRKASSLATLLLTLENLSFVQAGIAMLDVYSVGFMLASFWLYLKKQPVLSGLSVGLAALAKLSGALAFGAIFLHWLLGKRGSRLDILLVLIVASASFVLLMVPFDFLVSRQLLNPISRIETMLSLSGSLTFGGTPASNASRPWDWVLFPLIMPYWYQPNYSGTISFTIWALIIPAAVYMGLKARKGSAGLFGIGWFASTYLFWIPVDLITDRLTFLYYFYPTVGAICIGIALGLCDLVSLGKTAAARVRWRILGPVTGYLVLHVIVFVILSPVFNLWSTLANLWSALTQ